MWKRLDKVIGHHAHRVGYATLVLAYGAGLGGYVDKEGLMVISGAVYALFMWRG